MALPPATLRIARAASPAAMAPREKRAGRWLRICRRFRRAAAATTAHAGRKWLRQNVTSAAAAAISVPGENGFPWNREKAAAWKVSLRAEKLRKKWRGGELHGVTRSGTEKEWRGGSRHEQGGGHFAQRAGRPCEAEAEGPEASVDDADREFGM